MVRAAFALLVILLAGCDDAVRTESRSLDVEDPEFRQGQMFTKQNEKRRALECYLKVIDNRKGAAEAHLEAGRMYSDLEDPLPAIYHFNQYVRLKPTSEQTPMVKGMIRTAEKQFMQQLPGRPMEPDALGSVDINARLRVLQIENEKLKREVADLSRNQKTPDTKAAVGTGVPVATPDKSAPESRNGRTRPYTIVSGDTLSVISNKMFKDKNHIKAIFDANRDKMTSPNTLPKIGTVLQIPE
jgi:tetratricopeptide (TPR) repeat protein